MEQVSIAVFSKPLEKAELRDIELGDWFWLGMHPCIRMRKKTQDEFYCVNTNTGEMYNRKGDTIVSRMGIKNFSL